MSFYRWDGADLVLSVRVQPKASRDEWGPVMEDHIKVRITAPPVDGKANAYLCTYLSKLFKVPKTSIEVETGETGRNKRVRVCGPQRLPAEIVGA